MRVLVSLLLVCCVLTVGCVSADIIFTAADAGLKGYEAEVQAGSDEYVLADKLDDELQSLNILYADAEHASAAAKPDIESQIAAVAGSIAKDGQAFLSLVAIKNPQKRTIAAGVIAGVEAFIVVVQDKHPDPSGNSVQLNSSEAQLRAAGVSAGMMK